MESDPILKVIEIVYIGKPSRKECTIEMILYKYGLEMLHCISITQYTSMKSPDQYIQTGYQRQYTNIATITNNRNPLLGRMRQIDELHTKMHNDTAHFKRCLHSTNQNQRSCEPKGVASMHTQTKRYKNMSRWTDKLSCLISESITAFFLLSEEFDSHEKKN